MNKLADSFFARFTQARRLLRLELGESSPIADGDLIVERFHGRETIDGEFEYTVRVLADRDDLDLNAVIGRAVRLLLDTGGAPRAFHGHVIEFALAGSDGGFAAYTLTLAPWTQFLDQRRDWWVFQEKTAVAIIEEVFGDWKEGAVKARFEWRLKRPESIANRSYCVQAGETDLHFVRRLLEEEGLSSWFEIHGEGDATQHVLVIADDPSAYRALSPASRIRFHRQAATEKEDAITEWSARRHVGINRVSLTSHDYKPARSTTVSLTAGDRPRLSGSPPGQPGPVPSRSWSTTRAEANTATKI